jgi:integrase
LFCQPDGKPLHAANIARRDMRQVIKKAGVPRIRFHDLRHTTATHLLEQGENPKTVSELLGHSSVAFTMDVYAHVLPGRQAQMMARLQARLLGQKTPE